MVLTERGIEAVAVFTCPGRSRTDTLSFIVDTGSSASFLSWDDAVRLGIDVDSLPGSPKPIMGFGGSGTDVRYLARPCFLHFDFDATKAEQVALPDGILVYKPARTKTKRWRTEKSLSLLGRDFMKISGWNLVVNVAKNEFYFEK